MACSKRDVTDPETAKLLTYESSIKSGTHGELYQKQLALVLLLRLTRQEKNFRLAYELTSADKFGDVVLYDRTAKQWIVVQTKHSDGKDSKIDLNGLLPKTNREKGDFSLYKYFYSYMIDRNRFKGKFKFVLFTNKKLDEKLKTAENFVTIKDRYVDEFLRFTSDGATQKLLIPSEFTIQSIMEYTNRDLYSLKDAIKQLFIKGIITDQLLKYKAYLKDVLKETKNYQISFTDTFNESLIFISELYKLLQSELQNLKPIVKPPELDVKEMEHGSTNLPSVDLKHLADAIEDLFRNGIVSDYLKKFENLLALILTTTANGQLAFKDTFRSDVISKAELYRMLKAELNDMETVISTEQKFFDGKALRNKHHSLLFYAEESDVRHFFELLTLSVNQPVELESFIIEELYLWMRMWLRPDVLGKLTEYQYKNAVKDLDNHFEATLKRVQANSKPYFNQQYVSQFCNKLQLRIVELYPALNDTNQLYINRVLIFEKKDIDELKYLQASQFDGNTKSELSLNLEDFFSFKNENKLFTKTCEEMTDSEFAANLRVKFAQCQCLVLMADSGMGKTELLRYLALEHQKLSGTVYLLYLNTLQYSEEGIGNEASLNILKSVLSDKNILLIQKALENISYDPITILLDGYNEIHKKNIKKINRLLKLLFTSKQIQIVISVRNHEKPALQSFLKECKINVLYYSLEPFSKENVIEYLAQSWKEKVEIDIDFKFYSYSKVLVEKFYNLCSVPLMVKMMSKIYKQRFEQFKETGFIDKKDETSYLKKEFLEVEHIYEIFIKKCLLVKIDDACHGFGQVDLNKQVFVEFYLDHQLLAIEFLDVDELKFVFKNPKYMKNWDCIETNNQRQLEKSILLNFVDGKVSFSHYSYAEYFVATFLWDDFIDLKNIVKNVLSCSTGIRRFFIQIIEKNIKLFVSKIVHETSFDSKDVIFWACESDAVELLKYLLSKKTLFRPKEAKMLHIAIENGSDKICSYLIDDCIVHPDAKYDGDLAPLHSAIKYGRIKLVQILLRNGADINIQNSEGWSALHYAVHRKRIDIAELLIDKGIEVNSRSKGNWNALHIACNNGDAELANMLIENGAELLMRTNEDKTALDLAASSGCTEIVITIINNLINIYPLHSMIATAYRTADWCGYHTLQEALISKFPKLAGDLDIDETPIHFAARKGLFGKVKELINDGFNVNALSKSKLTALHLSASAGHRLVIDLLLDVGANINAVDGDNVTPLYLACQNGHTVVVETLIRRGSSIDILTHNELTVLHTSASKGHCDIVNLLLLEGAKINAVDGYGVTPLHLACENGHIEVVKTLVRRGANIHALTCDSLTALHVSAYEGNCSIVDLLLNYGANVNAVEIDKWTPLHLACQNGHIEVVKTLVERDANINALTANRWSALHVSAYGGHSIIVGLLLREGANIESVVKGDITLGAVYKLRRLIYGCLRTASFPK